jgi:hypothetical protein
MSEKPFSGGDEPAVVALRLLAMVIGSGDLKGLLRL